MLVLKRKIGESLIIGNEVEITILEQEGETIKIGINAPRSIRVYRKEIYEEVKKANQDALQSTLLDHVIEKYQQNVKNEEK